MNGWLEVARALLGEGDAPAEGEDPRAALDAIYQDRLGVLNDARAQADEVASARRRAEWQLSQVPDDVDTSALRDTLDVLAVRELDLAHRVVGARKRAAALRAQRARIAALGDDDAARERARLVIESLSAGGNRYDGGYEDVDDDVDANDVEKDFR